MNILPSDLPVDEFIGLVESQYARPTTDYADELKKRFKYGYQIRGEKLPWKKTWDHVRLRPGELSIWAGINGHRKSMLLGQVMLWLPRDQPVLIASLEMNPVDTLERMTTQALGGNKPTDEFVDTFLNLTDNIFLYDQQDSIPSDRILGMICYMAQEKGIKHVMLDSLMKCVSAADDWNQQKQFVDRLAWVARRYEIHINLVHHMRKGKSENDIPDKFDVKGAGEITDLADNVFVVHMNKEKKEKRDHDQPVEHMDPDQTLTVKKQRHGRHEGEFALYFREDSLQFVGGPDSGKLPWRYETRYPEAV